jgi:hypothetical protein
MVSQKNFSYEGNVTLEGGRAVYPGDDDIEIKSVDFLTPAKVTYYKDGVVRTSMVSVDIINREVYDDEGVVWHTMGKKVFAHLDAPSLSADFFAAPADVMHGMTEQFLGEK